MTNPLFPAVSALAVLLVLGCCGLPGGTSGSSQPAVPPPPPQPITVTDEPLSLKDGESVSYTVKPGHYRVKIAVRDTDGGQYGVTVSTTGDCQDQRESQKQSFDCTFDNSGTIIITNPTGFGFGPAEMGNVNIVKMPD